LWPLRISAVKKEIGVEIVGFEKEFVSGMGAMNKLVQLVDKANSGLVFGVVSVLGCFEFLVSITRARRFLHILRADDEGSKINKPKL